MTLLEGTKIIYISHFVNPNCFYFKFHDDLFDKDFKSFEDEISVYAENEINKLTDVQLKVNDIVAVFNIAWSKWVRAQIKSIYSTKLEPMSKYELWAIDHGQSIESTGDLLVLLPNHLKEKKTVGSYQGSIYGYVPAIPEFNLETEMKELRPVQEWSERALKLSKQLITNVSNTFFQVKLIKDNYCFGDLSVQLPNGKIVPWKKISDLDEITEVEFGKEIERIVKKFGSEFDSVTRSCRIQFDITTTGGLNNLKILNTVDGSLSDNSSEISQSTVRSVKLSYHKAVAETTEPIQTITDKAALIMLEELVQSDTTSTIIQSEIDGGKTRKMPINRKNVSKNNRNRSENQKTVTDCVQNLSKMPEKQQIQDEISSRASTIICSEIDNGKTRIQMNNRFKKNFNRRKFGSHIPAGHECDLKTFEKLNS